MSTGTTYMQSQSARSVNVLTLMTIGAYVLYIYLSEGNNSLYLTIASNPLFFIKPYMLFDLESMEPIFVTVLLTLTIMLHGLTYSILSFLVSHYATNMFNARYPRYDDSKKSKEIKDLAIQRKYRFLDCNKDYATIMLVPPVAPGQQPDFVEARHDVAYIHINVDQPQYSSSASAIQILNEKILAILKSNPAVPASTGGHHGDATLLEHSITVTRKLFDQANKAEIKDPLLESIGLAHDIDKLLAYECKDDGAWVRRATHFHTYGAHLIRNLPEFRSLEDDEKKTLNYTLKYYHHPEKLPLGAGERIETLIGLLRIADGITTNIESKNQGAVDFDSDNENALYDSLIKGLRILDVNAHQGSKRPYGWTSDSYEFLAVSINDLVSSAIPYLSEDLKIAIKVNAPVMQIDHPAINPVIKALSAYSLIKYSYKSVVSEDGLFVIQAGVRRFVGIVLLDKQKLTSIMPEITAMWGNSEYKMRVIAEWTGGKASN